MKDRDYILRVRFLRFIGKKLFRLKGGEVLPKSLKILSYILMPVKSYLYNNKKINYDFMNDYYVIEGCFLPAFVIREMSKPDPTRWYRFYMNEFDLVMIECKIDTMENKTSKESF